MWKGFKGRASVLTQVIVLASLSLVFFGACGSAQESYTHTPNHPKEDPYLLSAQVNSNIPLVINITWGSEGLERGVVTYWAEDGGEQQTLMTEFDTRHQIDLIGLLPLTEYHYKLIIEDEQGEQREELGSLTTGALSPYLPLFNVEEHISTTGYTLVPLVTAEGTGEPALVILNSKGEVVWYVILPSLSQPTAAIFSKDLKSALLQVGRTIIQIPLNGSEQIVHQTPDGHHDLIEPEAGTIAYLKFEYEDYGEKTIQSDSIVELRPNGEIIEVWNFFDHLDDFAITEEELSQMEDFIDLTHANSLQYSEEEDAYYINFTGGVKGFAKVSRATGETLWTMSQTTGWFYELTAYEVFSITHDIAVINETEFLSFVNITEESECARVAHVELDTSTGTATSTWVHGQLECLTVFGLGGLQHLRNGMIQVNWSTAGRMEEYDSDGGLLRRIESTFGYAFGYSHHVESFYAAD